MILDPKGEFYVHLGKRYSGTDVTPASPPGSPSAPGPTSSTRPACIRVQVSSGAFPRYARNTGTGEPIASATTLRAADQAVHHDPDHPSAVILPVRARR